MTNLTREFWAQLAVVAGLGIVTAATSGAELRIEPETLGRLPAGAKVHPSVQAVPADEGGALRFSEGGIVLPMAGRITAAAGGIDVRCQLPEDWPTKEDRALLHLDSATHSHVTLFFRDSKLMAVYKGSEARFSSIRYPASGGWKPGSWHRVQFGWQPGAVKGEVDFVLLVDGALAGVASGQMLERWPATCEVGVRTGRTPWRGLLSGIVLSDQPIAIPGMEPGRRTITVHADRETGDCYRFWTVANYNKPHLFLDPSYAKGLRRGQPYVAAANAVYLLGGRYRDQNNWFQGVDPDGSIRADFTGLVKELRGMMDGGFVPWPVLDNVPYNLSDPPQENSYGNTAPETDPRLWGRYVEAALRAMVEAFGREKVSSWWFRVGTEPDLSPGHWAGTREQWLAHYDETVAAATRVIPEAKIGPGNILNPAGGEFGAQTRGQWGLDIIDHCAAKGTRMDWFSFSWYGRVGQPISEFDQAVAAIRARLSKYPQYAGLPLIVGEHAALHDEGGRRLWGGDTSEWGASFYAALADRVYRHGIQQVYEWAETTSGVPHGRANVLGMLQDMSGGRCLAVEVGATSQADCGAIASRKGEELFVLVHNHRAQRRPKVPEGVHLAVRDPRMKSGASWKLSEWTIDETHGTWSHAFAADCAAAGLQPDAKAGLHEGSISLSYGEAGTELFRKNLAKYAKLAAVPQTRNADTIAAGDGELTIDLDLPGHSVRLLRVSPSVR